MNYNVNYPFGVTTILENKLNSYKYKKSNINDSTFIYNRLRGNSYKNNLESIKKIIIKMQNMLIIF